MASESCALSIQTRRASGWLRAGRRRGAVGAEAALGKRGLSTCPGTSALGVDRWHLCRWGGVGEAAGVYVYITKEKKKDG